MNDELAILDVAHGNTAILVSVGQAAVFDAAPRSTLLEAVEFYHLTLIDYVFISHADFDHVGGVINLLADKKLVIRNLLVNADASKDTKAWEALGIAIDDACARYKLIVGGLNSSQGPFDIGRAQVRVVSPSPGDSLLGAGTHLTSGRRVTSNASSVVLLVAHQGHPTVLFAADMEPPALKKILASQVAIRADVLVYPHHGGLVGGNSSAFALALTRQVQPKIAVFSIGRKGYKNPRPEVVAAVREAAPHVAIMCTQLSQNCYSPALPTSLDWLRQLTDLPGMGIETNSSCAGSIKIELAGENSVFQLLAEHQEFVFRHVPDAMCMNRAE